MNNPNTDYFTSKAANAVGVPAAVVLKHLHEHSQYARENIESLCYNLFWYPMKPENVKALSEGWYPASVKALSKEIPYLSAYKIREALKQLVSGGYVATGNYNQSKCDHTTWYVLTDAGRGLME